MAASFSKKQPLIYKMGYLCLRTFVTYVSSPYPPPPQGGRKLAIQHKGEKQCRIESLVLKLFVSMQVNSLIQRLVLAPFLFINPQLTSSIALTMQRVFLTYRRSEIFTHEL